MFNWDMTFSKAFPLKSERRQLTCRAEYRTHLRLAELAKRRAVQTNANLGRYTASANPRQMSMSLRPVF